MSVATPVFASPPQAARPAARWPSGSRLRAEGLTESDRNYSIAMHLTPLVLSLIGVWPMSLLAPLIFWLVRRNHSAFNDDHGREVFNFSLSIFLWHIILALTVVGLILWPVLWVVAIVSSIRGAVAAGNGEYFRYPMTIRFLA